MREVLVVEDDVALLEAIAEIVEALGYRARRATDGEFGLLAIRERRPDAVLTGYMMPRMDGIALCEELARDPELAALPVIVMSASKRPEGLPAKYPFIGKPFDMEELAALLKATIRGSSANPPVRRATPDSAA